MSTASIKTQVLEWHEARQRVIETVRSLTGSRSRTESVDLRGAHGRILACDVLADRDYPTLRRSLRDGFAVRYSDTPGTLVIRGEVRAGEQQKSPLQHGEALEIMTGAPLPDAADAVVMVEHVERITTDDGVLLARVDKAAEPGQWINEAGSESRAGAILITAGTRLDAGHIATLAMTGHSEIAVRSRPSVAVLATGDEIVDIASVPDSHQIRNSNSYMLAALVEACGGQAKVLPVAGDTAGALQPLLEEGLAQDMLVVTGGVSAGRYDLVKPTLQNLGATFVFERVRIQPGGPCTFGVAQSKPVFGLPGNPGSTYVTFQLFAHAALSVLGGESDPVLPLLTARFDAPFKHRLGLTRFLPARLSADGQHLTHIPWQGSSDVPALAKANAFLVADGKRDSWQPGDYIPVMRKI